MYSKKSNAAILCGYEITVLEDSGIVPDDEIEMHCYFGNLHSHSGISDGEGTPEEIMEWAKYDEKLDFYVMTDHAEQIFGSEWNEIKEQTDLYTENGEFVAMRGFEWSHPVNGHICRQLSKELCQRIIQ